MLYIFVALETHSSGMAVASLDLNKLGDTTLTWAYEDRELRQRPSRRYSYTVVSYGKKLYL